MTATAVEYPQGSVYRTVTLQAVLFGLVLLAGLWALPAWFWQGPQSLHIALEFIGALLALVVALGSIVRFIALEDRLVLLFGMSFLAAGLSDLVNATVSLDVLSTGQGDNPVTWTAGRLAHGVLLLAGLLIARWAPRARRINLEMGFLLTATVVGTGLVMWVLSRLSSEFNGSELTMYRRIVEWALVMLFFWCGWGYFQLFKSRQNTLYDWAAAAVVIFGVAQIYAALFVDWQESSVNIPHGLKVFGYVAALTGLFMENLALFQETERQRDELDVHNRDLERTNDELATLLGVTREIAETREADKLPQLILDRTVSLIPQAQTGILFLYDDAAERLVPKASLGFPFTALNAMRIRQDESIPGMVFSSGKTYVGNSSDNMKKSLDQLDEGNRILLDQASRDIDPVQQAICAPLIEHGDTIGVMLLNNHTEQAFTNHQVSFFETLCNQIAGAIRNAQLYAQIQQYTRQLQAKNQELESFVYTASHDLRSPLVSLHGLMAMFGKSIGPNLDDRGKRYLTRLEANVSQMEELIDGLLELSRVGRAQVKIEQLDMNKIMAELAEQVRPQVEENNIELTIHPLPVVAAPAIQIRQIFSNLISNGIKYMGDSEERRVEVGGHRDEDGVEFYVQDTGIGIDKAYQDKVFIIFQRLKELDDIQGTGVGLAIVKKIIENLEGTITLESEKGVGSKFTIKLPLLEPEEQPEPVQQEER